MKIDISIIIPFYKNFQWLLECLNSIYIEKYSYETIVILDGVDIKLNLDLSILAQHNIKIFNIEHNGAGAARNQGIYRAKGDYLLFLDSDDVLTKNYATRIIDEMVVNNFKWGHSVYRRFYHSNKLVKNNYFCGDVSDVVSMHCPISTSGVVIKNELFANDYLRFSEDVTVGEDTILWIKLSNIEKLYVTDWLGVFVRQHGNNSRLDKFAKFKFLTSSAYLESIDAIKTNTLSINLWMRLLIVLSGYNDDIINNQKVKIIGLKFTYTLMFFLKLLAFSSFFIRFNLRRFVLKANC